jgi:adenine phosphoribosyltransferase
MKSEGEVQRVNVWDLKRFIRDIPDFPKQGIVFKDITPLWGDKTASSFVVDFLSDRYRGLRIDKVVSPEARGFIIGAPLAYRLGAGFVPVRKRGKLPYRTIQTTYELEYGVDVLTMHEDAIQPGERVLIVDDLLATGGTAKAICELVDRLGGEVKEVVFLVELEFLNGRDRLAGLDVYSIIKYTK